MMPEEWPIAAFAADRNAPARKAGRGRLATVRADFFLDSTERLTEQERALMTAMLHCLIGDIADEIRAALPAGWTAANDEDNGQLVRQLTVVRLLDEAGLMILLLRRADEERIGSAARARSGRREARVLQGLVSHENGAVSAAAMGLILARGRRRDRFGQCLVDFDDLPIETAEALVHSIAAALRQEIAATRGGAAADGALSAAAAQLLARHDDSKGVDELIAMLVDLLEESGEATDELILTAGQEGEAAFVAQVLARRAGIAGALALDELLSGDAQRVMALFRVAGFSRELSAGLLAGVGDLLGIADPGAAIGIFDSMSRDQVDAAATWLTTSSDYRAALDMLGGSRG
jgi:Uncharacterised protein conserved in bacteria (DUF2336)